MPTRGEAPTRLSPVDVIEVDDSEDARVLGSAAPELLGAVEAYRAGNHQAALARFFEVMRDPLRSSMPKQLSQLYAAKALVGLELPHASWMLLDEIASNRSSAMRAHALPWLGLLASHIDTDAVLESLASYDASDRDRLTKQKDPLKERLAYLFGRRAFLAGDASAVGLLEQVRPTAVDHPKALFMLGVVHVRDKEPEAALDTFDAVLASLVRPGLEEPERIRGMAEMARARVLYALGDEQPNKLEEALTIYRRAQSFEDVSLDARVETVWTLLRLKRFDDALTELSAARPLLRTRHAEVDGLEVTILLGKCSLEDAAKGLESAKVRHSEIQAHIKTMVGTDVSDRVADAVAFGLTERKPKTVDEQVIAVASRRSRLARMLERFAAIRAEQKRADGLPLDFKQSAAGKRVAELVKAARVRTEAAVAQHLAIELEELGEITATQLAELDKLAAELERLRASGC